MVISRKTKILAGTLAFVVLGASTAVAHGTYAANLARPSYVTTNSTITAEGCQAAIHAAPNQAWADYNDDQAIAGQECGLLRLRLLYPGGTYSSWASDYNHVTKSSTTYVQAQFQMQVIED